MDRLTERRDAQWVIPLRNDGRHKWALCKAGMSLDDSSEYLYGDHANRLAAYEDAMPLEWAQKLAQAEKDGRLVVLPVPVGKGKVAYAIPDSFSRDQEIFTIECERLDGLEIWKNPGREVVVVVDGCEVGESDIGKTVFLTHEEAEAALKKREEADDEDN